MENLEDGCFQKNLLGGKYQDVINIESFLRYIKVFMRSENFFSFWKLDELPLQTSNCFKLTHQTHIPVARQVKRIRTRFMTDNQINFICHSTDLAAKDINERDLCKSSLKTNEEISLYSKCFLFSSRFITVEEVFTWQPEFKLSQDIQSVSNILQI